MHVDGDDWIEPNMLEIMYNKANSGNYDYVGCGVFVGNASLWLWEEQDTRYCDKSEIMRRFFNGGLYGGQIWNKLIKRSIWLSVIFPFHGKQEDIVCIAQAIYFATNICYINVPLYHYCINPNSMTQAKDRIIRNLEDSYHNHLLRYNFLKDKFNDISIFFPGLANLDNRLKYKLLLHKQTRYLNANCSLNPEADQFLFDKRSGMSFAAKVILCVCTFETRLIYLFMPYLMLRPLLRKLKKK